MSISAPDAERTGRSSLISPATRYVGETAQGFLVHAEDMIRRGLLSPTATLVIAARDIDSNTGATLTWDLPRPPELEIIPPEEDFVTFNGRTTAPDEFHNPATLLGENGKWSLTAIDIDIRNVKFPEKGVNGAEPTPAINQIQIDVDTAFEAFPLFCIEGIDWVALHFKTVSPIILIHGNGSNPGFFTHHGFNDRMYSSRWPFEGCSENTFGCKYPIELDTGPIADNADALAQEIPRIAKALGVNSVHLVAHSKGGLDSRDYLARKQPQFDNTFQVLSYTSLATPHNGSPGADVSDGMESARVNGAKVRFDNFTQFQSAMAFFDEFNPGRPFLTTNFLNSFNFENLARLEAKAKTKYWHLLAADADRNSSLTIDQLLEWQALKLDDARLANVFVPDSAKQFTLNQVYQFMRRTSNVETFKTFGPFFLPGMPLALNLPVLILRRIDGGPFLNDSAVQEVSGLGLGSVASLPAYKFDVTPILLLGPAGRNHSDIADGSAAVEVRNFLLRAEALDPRGDIR